MSEGHDGSDCTAETTSCLNCKGNHCCAFSKYCPVWIQEKEIQRIKTEKCVSYGDARRLFTSSVSSPSSSSSSASSSYASAVKTIPKKVTMSVDCQTPSFWVGPQPSLREASRLPSVQTASTGTGTCEITATSNLNNSPTAFENRASHKRRTKQMKCANQMAIVQKNNSQNIETSNKYKQIKDMGTTQSHRPSRSQSRSRSRSKNISPIKHQ